MNFFSNKEDTPCPQKTFESIHVVPECVNAIQYTVLDNNTVQSIWYVNNFTLNLSLTTSLHKFLKLLERSYGDGNNIQRHVYNELSEYIANNNIKL